MRQIITAIMISMLFVACQNEVYKFKQANIEFDKPDVEIHRYGKTLFELDTSNFRQELINIQDRYSLFLNADLNDSGNIVQLLGYVSDTQLISIYHKTIEVYPGLHSLEGELEEAFGRYNHFYPDRKIPEVYTYISDLYYEMPVWKNDSLMIIALDVYLGADFYLYKKLGLPFYKVRCMEPVNIVLDAMKGIYLRDVATDVKKRTLLDHMISGGKMLTFLDAVLPHVPDSVKICYTAEKTNWANNNEKNVWAFLIENDLLYTTDYQSQTKLIQDGPFTTGFSNESPSRLGVFLGWKIVTSFMKNNPDISLSEMLEIKDSQSILQKSGYKP